MALQKVSDSTKNSTFNGQNTTLETPTIPSKNQSGDSISTPITSSLRSSVGGREGWVWMKRKTAGRKRRRYLKVSGSVMTSQKKKKTSIEWDASLLGCRVRASPKRGSMMIAFANGTKAYITVVPKEHCKVWVECIKIGSSHKFEDLYEIQEKIGEGGFAKVHCGRDKTTGEKVAIKVIRKNIYDLQATRELEREMQIVKTLNHSRIIKTYDVFHVQDRAYIVMELMQGGTLKDRIEAAGGTIPEIQARDIIREVLEACAYLHSNGVVHRDIKLENVLCKSKQMPQRNTKLADFGYVNFMQDSHRDTFRSLVGTPLYVAAEIIQRKAYGAPVDIYACGVMAYRMISGKYPYNAEDDETTMKLALEGKLIFPHSLWSSASPECISFLKSILHSNPQIRLTAAAALAHSWFNLPHVQKTETFSEKTRSSLSQRISRFGQRISTATSRNQDHKDGGIKTVSAGCPYSEPEGGPNALRLRGREALRARILATLFMIRIGVAAGVRAPPRGNITTNKSLLVGSTADEPADSDEETEVPGRGRRMMNAVRSLSLQLGQGITAVRNRVVTLATTPRSLNTPRPWSNVTRRVNEADGPLKLNNLHSARPELAETLELEGSGKGYVNALSSWSTPPSQNSAESGIHSRVSNNPHTTNRQSNRGTENNHEDKSAQKIENVTTSPSSMQVQPRTNAGTPTHAVQYVESV